MIRLHLHLVFIFCITVFNASFAQPGMQWVAAQVGTTSGDASNSFTIFEDASGNIYTAGRFAGTVDFDPGPGVNNVTASSSLDIYISKKDASGNLLWIKNFGTSSVTVSEITGDNAGNVYITGGFQNTIDFDPGVGVSNLTSNGFQDLYILKLDGTGVFQWVKSAGDTNFDRGKAIFYDEVNNQLLVSGDFVGTVDFDPGAPVWNLTSNSTDAFLMSLNTAGDFQWVQQFTGGSDEYIEGITNDSAGNIFIVGFFYGDIDVDPGAGFQGLTSVGNNDVFVCKLQNNGGLIWSTQLGGGTMSNKAWDIDVDESGDVLFTGDFTDELSFVDVNSTPITITTNGGRDIFTCKLNSTGGIIWVSNIGGTGTDGSLSVDSRQGIVYVAGSYSGLVDFDTGPGVAQLPDAGSGTNACLYSLNTNGEYLWAYSFGNSGGSSVNGSMHGVLVDDQGDVFATGLFTGTAAPTDLDPGPGTFNVAGAPGNNNAFTIKLGCTAVSGTDIVSESCSYTWIDGNTYYADNNTATWTLPSQYGCDSIITLNLTLSDLIAPVADIGSLSDIIGECEITSLTPPTATDNCAGSIIGTHNASLPINNQGTTLVTWTYDDGNGNTSIQTQNIVITDVTAPVPDVANLVDYSDECPVELATIGGTPTATDNCSGAIIGTPDVTFPITASGTTTITWTYDDGNGNTSTQTQDVTITSIDNGITQVDAVTLSADASAAAYTYQWVDCDNGNALVNGATSQTFTPTVAGSYACIIDNGFCSVTTDCLTSSVGIVENSFGSALVVYPNPTLGQLKIDLGDTYDGISVKVFNALGQSIIDESFGSTSEIELNIEGTPGMYILEVKAENGKAAKVTIVKK